MAFMIEVTQDDIDHAQAANSGHCPVARALAFADSSYRHVAVTRETMRFTDRDLKKRFKFATPNAVRTFIDNWDNERPVAPFAFDLEKCELLETSAQKSRDPKTVGKGTAPYRAPKNPGARNKRPVYNGSRATNGNGKPNLEG